MLREADFAILLVVLSLNQSRDSSYYRHFDFIKPSPIHSINQSAASPMQCSVVLMIDHLAFQQKFSILFIISMLKIRGEHHLWGRTRSDYDSRAKSVAQENLGNWLPIPISESCGGV